MQYRNLGGSGLKVPALMLGTATFGGGTEFFKKWGTTDVAEASSLVDAALEMGCNMFDTADAYSRGMSEEILGKAIEGRRDKMLLATKVGMPMGEGPNDMGTSRERIIRCCEASLRRLGTDYIDLYQLHSFDAQTPIEEMLHALDALTRAGKIRYFGVSNYRGWRIAEMVSECEAQGVPLPVVCQPYYNLLNRMPEVEVLPACDHYGIGVASYSPVARGVLTGKYAPGAPMPVDSRGARGDRRMAQTELREESFVIAQKLREHAEKTGRSLLQFALAWLWANRVVSSVIAGPRTPEQWNDYVASLGTPWSDEDEALVDSLVVPGHASTPGYNDPQYPFFGRVRD